MRVLGLIPARGGSKGLPRKNVLEAGGIPLLAWTIRVAQQCHQLDRLVLSSDDDDIIEVARREGCDVPFRRPAALACDTASSADVVVHALEQLGHAYDAVLLLQPTSPLRQRCDLDAALGLFEQQSGTPGVVSVVEVPCPLALQYGMDASGTLRRLHPEAAAISRRQDAEAVVTPNGAIYLVGCDWFIQHRRFVGPQTQALLMPRDRSLDIDEPGDLEYLRYLCAKNPGLVPPPMGLSAP